LLVARTGRIEKSVDAHLGAVLATRWSCTGNDLVTGDECLVFIVIFLSQKLVFVILVQFHSLTFILINLKVFIICKKWQTENYRKMYLLQYLALVGSLCFQEDCKKLYNWQPVCVA